MGSPSSSSSSWAEDEVSDDGSHTIWSWLGEVQATDADITALLEFMSEGSSSLFYSPSDSCGSSWGDCHDSLTIYGCFDCGVVPHNRFEGQHIMRCEHLCFDNHNCADPSGIEWRNSSMNTDHNLNARDRNHLYKDFRSSRKARNRQCAERDKYYNYRGINRGQLGKVHYKPDYIFGFTTPLADAETHVVTKKNLYDMAQQYPRPPKYHKSHAWDKGYNERRLQKMRDIKRHELDESNYDTGSYYWCCSYCCCGTGLWDLLYGIDDRKRWEGDGSSPHNLANLHPDLGGAEVVEDCATEEELHEAEQNYNAYIDALDMNGRYDEEHGDYAEADDGYVVEETKVFRLELNCFPPLPSMIHSPLKLLPSQEADTPLDNYVVVETNLKDTEVDADAEEDGVIVNAEDVDHVLDAEDESVAPSPNREGLLRLFGWR